MKSEALKYLRQALGNAQADFRDGQWESIEHLLNRNRVLVVQRTGWGKSMVYFLATKLLRERGAGPTLIISPLLSLMRNQMDAAERLGVVPHTINHTNKDKRRQIQDEWIENKIDVLLISPERLADDDFRQNFLGNMAGNIGLFVVDEAHCISDWGYDFRPDYRRIVHVLDAFPPNVPVLATTATANNRVVEDIKSQLGENILLKRGSLVRTSLKLQNINMPSPAARMAWLAKTIPALPGSGIVYTLTKPDAERLAGWLQGNDINAKAYHAGVPDKEELEQQLLNNKIKVLVATVALGMGFDKPDLGFVIHFQRPASVVHYYQQVGRAGRAVDEAYGILLCGEEDDDIALHFIRSAFPAQQHISKILKVLDESDNELSVPEIQKVLNLPERQIEKTLTFLALESPAPATKIGYKWRATPTSGYQVDQAHINQITNIRHKEQQQMRNYMTYQGCLMSFLQSALDDQTSEDCGRCRNCNPSMLLDEAYDGDLANQAGLFLRRNYQKILPRKQWLSTDIFQFSPLGKYGIPEEYLAREGRALSLWGDAGWGQLVAQGKKYATSGFSDELVTACQGMIQDWSPDPAPKWVTCIPSSNYPDLVPDFATRLSEALGLPFIPCVKKVKTNQQQKIMENSYQQVRNLDGVFNITDQCKDGACLLVDDMVDSRWTFTVVAALLRQAGCSAVYPMALALNSLRMDR